MTNLIALIIMCFIVCWQWIFLMKKMDIIFYRWNNLLLCPHSIFSPHLLPQSYSIYVFLFTDLSHITIPKWTSAAACKRAGSRLSKCVNGGLSHNIATETGSGVAKGASSNVGHLMDLQKNCSYLTDCYIFLIYI